MNVYLLTDMEGISLVYKWNQVKQGSPFYARYAEQLSREVGAAAEGMLAGGATRVVINDGHGSDDYNLLWRYLPDAVEIERPDSSGNVFPSLDDSFAALFMVGAHAAEGTPNAVLAHTQSHTAFLSYAVNGTVYGEIGQAAIIAGHFGVPVGYVSGDAAAVAEARALLGDKLPGTVVKRGHRFGAATSLHPDECVRRIRQDAEAAMAGVRALTPYRIAGPCKVDVTYKSEQDAMTAAAKPGAVRSGFTVTNVVPDATQILNV